MTEHSAIQKWQRYLLIQTLAIAFGGFLLYAAIVVPAATEVIGSTTQGFVTQRVTNSLNFLSAFAAIMLTWDFVAFRQGRSSKSNLVLISTTICIGVCTLALASLHLRLDSMLDGADRTVRDSNGFYAMHRIYLWIATLQWLASLLATWIVIQPTRTSKTNT